MAGYIDHLARELPLCDLKYVRKHHPDAIRQAERYNAARRAVTFEDPETITRARRAKQVLIDAIG